jgi:hypothetical protein
MPEPTFTYSVAARAFTDSAGESFDLSAVRGVVNQMLGEVIGDEVLPLGVALQNGEISAVDWALRMEGLIKQTQTAVTSIAFGGWQEVGAANWGKLGGYVKKQYGFLDDLFRGIQNGDVALDSDFLRRSAMYIRDAAGTFQNMLRFALDYTEERRLLDLGARHCQPCLGYSALGWQPPGSLPDIGEDCDCISNCLCAFELR